MKTNRKLSSRLTISRGFTNQLQRERHLSHIDKAKRYARTEKGRAAKARYARRNPLANSLKAKRYYANHGDYVRFRNRLDRLLMRIVRAEEARGRFE